MKRRTTWLEEAGLGACIVVALILVIVGWLYGNGVVIFVGAVLLYTAYRRIFPD